MLNLNSCAHALPLVELFKPFSAFAKLPRNGRRALLVSSEMVTSQGRVGDFHVSHMSREKHKVLGRARESARCTDQDRLLRTSASRRWSLLSSRTGHPFAA